MDLQSSAELFSKESQDHAFQQRVKSGCTREDINGVIIVGAGPSGMATAACLNAEGIPNIILEKEHCIAYLWQHKSYDRLTLHIPKDYCQLPFMPFPSSYPTFVTRNQFIDYLKSYARSFDIQPRFGQTVKRACFFDGKWHVLCSVKMSENESEEVEYKEYVGKWLVVASGENSEAVIPCMPGLEGFKGPVIHSSDYKNGAEYQGKKVLVVGCGNSGMEIALDLSNHGSKPSLVLRSSVHILPKRIMGISTFSMSMQLMKVFSIQTVDRLLLLFSKMVLGDTTSYNIRRPIEGPLELKFNKGKTPVLDTGTMAKIKSGDIKVVHGIKHIDGTGVQFIDNNFEEFDMIIFATGYRSNVPCWLEDDGDLFAENGLPKTHNMWKVEKKSLYVVGMSRKGLLGSSIDANLVAKDIKKTHYWENKDISWKY